MTTAPNTLQAPSSGLSPKGQALERGHVYRRTSPIWRRPCIVGVFLSCLSGCEWSEDTGIGVIATIVGVSIALYPVWGILFSLVSKQARADRAILQTCGIQQKAEEYGAEFKCVTVSGSCFNGTLDHAEPHSLDTEVIMVKTSRVEFDDHLREVTTIGPMTVYVYSCSTVFPGISSLPKLESVLDRFATGYEFVSLGLRESRFVATSKPTGNQEIYAFLATFLSDVDDARRAMPRHPSEVSEAC